MGVWILYKLIEDISSLWYSIHTDDKLFVLSVVIVGVLALLLLLMVLFGSTRKSPRVENTVTDTSTTFVPVDSDKDTEEIFLPLADKLLVESTHHEVVSAELRQKIRSQKPGSLSDVLLAINKIHGPYRHDLRKIIAEEQMLTAYAHSLGQADYQPYTLAAAWHECPDPAVLADFVDLLASREEAVQMAAVRLLIALNEPQSLTYLASALLQPHRYVPARVAEVLIAMGGPAAWLLCYLLPEVPGESKQLVLSVLGQMQPGYPLEQVIVCLYDANEQTRRAAAAALGDVKAVSALNELCAVAADPDWSVRSAVAKALGQIGEPAALHTLRALAKDDVWMVSINAREAMRQFKVDE